MKARKGKFRQTRPAPMRQKLCSALLLAMFACTTPAWAQRNDAAQTYSIPAGDLAGALDQLASQSKVQIIYPAELVRGKSSIAVSGQQTWREALQKLLVNTGLTWGFVNDTTVVIKKSDAVPQPAERPKPQARIQTPPKNDDIVRMPAIMVQGKRTLNMDITRTRDDPQPYVVFEREQIENSGASNLQQFLQQRLTMNTSTINSGGGITSTSQITLRGLSAAQTLILIDGHRVSSPSLSNAGFGSLNQADITGIPLAAIERIEVLPTTASGIYGGSATGGVINIIMRRDYTGAEVKFTYDNTFSTDTATRQLGLTLGHNFGDGKTNVLLTANYSDANDLLVDDRDFVQRGRKAIWNNNPSSFVPPLGIPPLGATTNIASSDGSALVLKDGTPLNATFTSVPVGYAGPGSDGGAGLVTNAGSYNWEMANTAQSGSGSGGGRRRALYTQPAVKSGSMVLRHQFDDSLQVFADLSTSHAVNRFPDAGVNAIYVVPETSSGNPFAQAIMVTVPLSGADSELKTTIEHDRALLGLVKQLHRNWQIGADYTWDRTAVTYDAALGVSSAFRSAILSGQIDVLRDTNTHPVDIAPYLVSAQYTSPFQSTMKDANVRASGPIARFGGGDWMLSTSLAHRNEVVPDAFNFLPTNNLAFYLPERSQSVTSAYLEISAPLFSEKNARPGLRELELQVALRRDSYISRSGEIFATAGALPSPLPEVRHSRNSFVSVDPTIALRWKPIQDLTVRASYGTGFLPPALDRLTTTISASPIISDSDPLRGNTPAGPYTYAYGGNPDLEPEQSESWSAGIIVTPRMLPDLRLSLDYTRIKKTNNIATHPGFTQGLINDEALFPGRIVRGPNLPGDPPGWAGPIIFIDNTAMNLARAELEAWDAQLDYRYDGGEHGVFDLFLVGTWQPHFKTQVIENQPIIENAGVSSSNPIKFKANAGLVWNSGGWRAGWNVTYFDAYLVSSIPAMVASQGGSGKVPSQIYHDAFVNYDFAFANSNALKWLTATEVQLGIRNIFNKAPPFDASNTFALGGGLYSPFGDPRLASWYLSITTRF